MTVVNPKSISGINSITTGSGSDDILTIHNNNGTERLRIDSTGTTKIVTGIVTTLTATSSAKVGSGVTLSPDGDIFATGVCTATSFVGDGAGLSNVGVDTGVVFTDKLSVGDSPELISVGVGSDFQINHNGGTGNTNVIQQTGSVYFYTGSDLNLLLKDGAEVALYHANTKQCETSANGLAFPSGKGIDFSATSDAGGMTSELLDDYEEGTWTPTFSSSGATFVYNHQSGSYQKVGNTVHVQFYITLSGTNSSGLSGNAITINLPFTATSYNRYEAAATFGMIYRIDLVGYGNPVGTVYQSNTHISILGARDNNTQEAYSSDRFDESGAGISGSVTYRVS